MVVLDDRLGVARLIDVERRTNPENGIAGGIRVKDTGVGPVGDALEMNADLCLVVAVEGSDACDVLHASLDLKERLGREGLRDRRWLSLRLVVGDAGHQGYRQHNEPREPFHVTLQQRVITPRMILGREIFNIN